VRGTKEKERALLIDGVMRGRCLQELMVKYCNEKIPNSYKVKGIMGGNKKVMKSPVYGGRDTHENSGWGNGR